MANAKSWRHAWKSKEGQRCECWTTDKNKHKVLAILQAGIRLKEVTRYPEGFSDYSCDEVVFLDDAQVAIDDFAKDFRPTAFNHLCDVARRHQEREEKPDWCAPDTSDDEYPTVEERFESGCVAEGAAVLDMTEEELEAAIAKEDAEAAQAQANRLSNAKGGK